MSEACSIQSLCTTWPRMSSPRISRALCSASAGSFASLTPPALPRPPVSTCALTTTGPPSSSAAARASSGVVARRPSETGIPNCLKSCLPWYSLRSIGARTLATWLTSPPMDAIVVDTLRKRYGDVQALDGVSFTVREGEGFGLLGPNGAGKSTTVRVLGTLTHADEGTASVAGNDVRAAQTAVRRTIGYVPQDSGVDQFGTGRENLMLQGRVQGMSGRDLRDRTSELLELVGIADAADRIVKTYSGGMRRRLDIALGLVPRPRVLFLDEPTTGLDPEARVAMWSEVSRLAEAESLTILLTTHYLEEADQLADRLAIVSQGRVVVEGTPTALKQGLRGDAVQVELDNGAVEDAKRVLAGVGAPAEQVLEGRTIVSRVRNGGRELPGILSALEAAGISVASVSLSRPSLDDVYLHFTGRDFNAEDRG